MLVSVLRVLKPTSVWIACSMREGSMVASAFWIAASAGAGPVAFPCCWKSGCAGHAVPPNTRQKIITSREKSCWYSPRKSCTLPSLRPS